MNRLAHMTIAAAIAISAAACGGSNDSQNVVAPSGTLTTDTFTGVVQIGGTSVNNFTVTTPGTISVTLVSTSPQPTLTMGPRTHLLRRTG